LRKLRLKDRTRLVLLNFGRRMTLKQMANVNSIHSYLELGYWLSHEMPGGPPRVVGNDEALFSIALSNIKGERPLYLEFGVWQGRSMRWWSRNLGQPAAKLIGFDSFQGLPSDWRPGLEVGTFATDGPPSIADDRVSFQVGWFEDTLRNFSMPDHDQLIINIDSDLYSSAATVLKWAEPYLKPGTLLYFDEFPDRDHEMRAYKELLESSRYEFRPIAFASGGIHWLFEVVG